MKKLINKIHKNSISRNWDKIYIAVDIHDTIVLGNYKTDELPTEYIGKAKKVLRYLSKRNDVVLIISTCSHPTEIKKYLEFFENDKIYFKFANENPDVPNTALGCYDKKMYFNLLLEDKAGFDAKKDWIKLYKIIKKLNFNNEIKSKENEINLKK